MQYGLLHYKHCSFRSLLWESIKCTDFHGLSLVLLIKKKYKIKVCVFMAFKEHTVLEVLLVILD